MKRQHQAPRRKAAPKRQPTPQGLARHRQIKADYGRLQAILDREFREALRRDDNSDRIAGRH